MNSQSSVLLFTGSYPYEAAAEHTFLDPEMASLCARFDRVIILPGMLEGKRRPVPDKVIVDESYARDWQQYYQPLKAIGSALSSQLFWQEILNRPATLLQFKPLKRALWISTSAAFTADWVAEYITANHIDAQSSVFYTYWLDHITLGIGLAKRQHPGIKVISRAHHYDLYEYFYQPAYIPFRKECLSWMDGLFLISDDGKAYMEKKYPRQDGFYHVSRLGVKNPGFTASASHDDVFRIASCSFMVPFKRVDLLLQGLIQLAQAYPKQKFEWSHIGDGPVMPQIQQLAENIPTNLSCNLLGHLPNQEVMNYYRSHAVDVFINVSQSEGIPVSIMEAQSCGIPVIATAVGGTPEIVDHQNGFLLSKNPSPHNIADAIGRFIDHPSAAAEKRELSLDNWKKKFNSEENFSVFTQTIRSLIS